MTRKQSATKRSQFRQRLAWAWVSFKLPSVASVINDMAAKDFPIEPSAKVRKGSHIKDTTVERVKQVNRRLNF